ncbi:MAG: PP2C family protein-serine/threonine phosphatase [Steroidobacteraceae bacterium]
MRVEVADVTHAGHREDNQDRSVVVTGRHAAMLAVFDGMGGHADGGRAAELGCEVVLASFRAERHPLLDPLGFLARTLGFAHEAVAGAGLELPLQYRPRATCALCLVQQGSAYWIHLGDARAYQLREGRVVVRTRDHTRVEQLLAEGVITEEQVLSHPLRNFVDSCVGGDPDQPEFFLSGRRPLQEGDVLALCSDGVWSGVKDGDLAQALTDHASGIVDAAKGVVAKAVRASAPYSDNATLAALRWLGN